MLITVLEELEKATPKMKWENLSVELGKDLRTCRMKCPICKGPAAPTFNGFVTLRSHVTQNHSTNNPQRLLLSFDPFKLLACDKDVARFREGYYQLRQNLEKHHSQIVSDGEENKKVTCGKTLHHNRSWWIHLPSNNFQAIKMCRMKCPACKSSLADFKYLLAHYKSNNHGPRSLNDYDPFTLLEDKKDIERLKEQLELTQLCISASKHGPQSLHDYDAFSLLEKKDDIDRFKAEMRMIECSRKALMMIKKRQRNRRRERKDKE